MSCLTSDISEMGTIVKLEARASSSGETGTKDTPPVSTQSTCNNNNSSSSGKSATAGGSGQKVLPSFNDLLWCPDVDGEIMTQGIGGAMVRSNSVPFLSQLYLSFPNRATFFLSP